MAMTKARRASKESQIEHNVNKLTNFGMMLDLAMARRNWRAGPETFDYWFINRTLTVDTEMLGFIDPDIGPLCLPVSSYGRLDVYGRPTGFYVWGMNGYHRYVPASEGVRLFNNESRTSTLPLIFKTAELLTQLDELCLTNLETCKTPFLIQCSEEQRQTITQLLNDVTKNHKYIWADKQLDAKDIRLFQTGATLMTDQIQAAKGKILNFALMQLGYEHTNVDKKERLVAAEVSSNFGIVEAIRKACIEPAQRFCKECQEKLFLPNGFDYPEFTCEFNSDLPTMINHPELITNQEGGAPADETV